MIFINFFKYYHKKILFMDVVWFIYKFIYLKIYKKLTIWNTIDIVN